VHTCCAPERLTRCWCQKTQHNHCMQRTHFLKTTHSSIRVLPCLHCRSEKKKTNSAVSMNLRTPMFRWTGYTSVRERVLFIGTQFSILYTSVYRQTSSVRNTSDGGGPRLERVPGRSEQGKPWPKPPTWAAFISMYGLRGLADDYVTTNWHLQSPKTKGLWAHTHTSRLLQNLWHNIMIPPVR